MHWILRFFYIPYQVGYGICPADSNTKVDAAGLFGRIPDILVKDQSVLNFFYFFLLNKALQRKIPWWISSFCASVKWNLRLKIFWLDESLCFLLKFAIIYENICWRKNIICGLFTVHFGKLFIFLQKIRSTCSICSYQLTVITECAFSVRESAWPIGHEAYQDNDLAGHYRFMDYQSFL